MKVLLIDGENFRHTLLRTLQEKNALFTLNLRKLLELSFPDLVFNRVVWYGTRIKLNKDDLEKSQEMINFQRQVFLNMYNQNIEVNKTGKIQRNLVGGKWIYKEKGVDVQIAVDMTALSYTDKDAEIYLLSNDSDLVSAIKHVRKNGTKVHYVCTEVLQVKAVGYSSDTSKIIREKEIKEVYYG